MGIKQDDRKYSERESERKYRTRIQVRCSECGWVDEDDTEFVNIEEDFQGADQLTFICNKCNTQSKSKRYG